MRISDWSSDVCSSDLHDEIDVFVAAQPEHRIEIERIDGGKPCHLGDAGIARRADQLGDQRRGGQAPAQGVSSEERRVGKECVSTCISRRSPNHEKKARDSMYRSTQHTYTR